MNIAIWMLIAFAAIANCDEKPAQEAKDRKDGLTITIKDDTVSKRQTGQESTIGITQHIQYGASPGHYVIKTAKEEEPQYNVEYLNLLKRLQGTIQTSAAEPKPAVQQYVVQRNPRPYQVRPSLRDSKLVKVDPYAENEQQLLIDDKYYIQQQYQQPRVPLVLRPSQAVKASPVQGIYTSQGYVPMSGGLHEARVQAALSVADNKPTGFTSSQSAYKTPAKHQSAFADSSFEKELAELVAANQAVELKERPQQFAYYQQSSPNNQQITSPKKFSQITISQQSPSYSSAIPLARSKTPGPQQYLIETTKPQAVQSRVVPQKVKPQYVQLYSDEPKYAEYQPVQEQKSALKIVSAPSLQTPQPPTQYEYVPQKQVVNSPPSYLKYYQSIKPQTEEINAPKEVKIGQFYPKYNVPKQQLAISQGAAEEQQQYVIQYQSQARPEEPRSEYVRYEAAKPQLVQYSNENEAFIQAALAAQQSQKSNRHSTPYAQKSVKIQPKPQTTTPKEEAHSSIFVSKTIAPKKQEQSVKILNPTHTETTEEVQTVRLPPPKNNKVYTQEEFQALLAAGYSVTPIPVTDDDENPAKFSPAPSNYPGHRDYQVQYLSSAPEQQYYEKGNSEAYAQQTDAPQQQVLRKRKQRRPTISPEYRLAEAQSQQRYAQPLDTEETINYGMRKHSKNSRS